MENNLKSGGNMENLEQRVEENGMETDYLAAIKELKSNSVSRDEYLRLKNENKQLLNSLVNGETIEPQVQVQKPNADELRNELFSKDHSNLEYIDLSLKLRDTLIENGEPDPFLPHGSKIVPTNEDIETANRVAAVFKECVEYADGNDEIFTNELMRRTIDTAPRRR